MNRADFIKLPLTSPEKRPRDVTQTETIIRSLVFLDCASKLTDDTISDGLMGIYSGITS
jgi:hypothetical protein